MNLPLLAETLRRFREDAHLTPKQLAIAIGKDPKFVYRIESGSRPRFDSIALITTALGLTEAQNAELLMLAGYQGQATEIDGQSIGTLESFFKATKRILYSLRLAPDVRDTIFDALTPIITFVVNTWSDKRGLAYTPIHGPLHNVKMLEVLYKYFGNELTALSADEIRLLFSAIWLHDIGMALEIGSDDDVYGATADRIYVDYPARSAAYVADRYLTIGISKTLQPMVSALCRHHRYRHLSSLQTDTVGEVSPLRLKALLALLQISDLLEVRPERVQELDHIALPFDNPAIMLEVYGEWLRNLFIGKISRDGLTLRVDIAVDRSWSQDQIRQLVETIEHDLRARLNQLKDYLALTANRGVVLWIEVTALGSPIPGLLPAMNEALDNLRTHRSPNARKVIDYILGSFSKAIAAKDSDRCLSLVRALCHRSKLRPYHAQLLNLYQALQTIVGSVTSLSEQQLKAAAQEVEAYTRLKDAVFQRIRAFSSQFRPEHCLLLCGYSELAHEALRDVSKEVKASASVVVMECRHKTIYSAIDDAVEYCEGVEQASYIRGLGFANVWVISDVCIASLFERSVVVDNEHPPRPTHVLLGVNAIDLSANVYGVVGYLTVARLANLYATGTTGNSHRVKVVVFAEGKKIHDYSWGDQERWNSWLPSSIKSAMDSQQIRVYQPLDDRVPAALISQFVTEKGDLSVEELATAYPEFDWHIGR